MSVSISLGSKLEDDGSIDDHGSSSDDYDEDCVCVILLVKR